MHAHMNAGIVPVSLTAIHGLSELWLHKNPALRVPEDAPLDPDGDMFYQDPLEVMRFFVALPRRRDVEHYQESKWLE